MRTNRIKVTRTCRKKCGRDKSKAIWCAATRAGKILGVTIKSDIDCLRSIKESLEDPENLLSSWDFNNSTEGFICGFTGIECWHPDESKVLNIRLSDMGLRGPFPLGLKKCTSLTGLDLSSNQLTGQLPSNIADVLPFVVTLDLTSNNLSGPIPPDIGNLNNINVLRLGSNQLTGQIPYELGRLYRMKEFSVADNRLSGQVPNFPTVPAESYAGNLGLCGGPLPPCKIINESDMFYKGLSMSNITSLLKRLSMVNKVKHHFIPPTPGHVLFTDQTTTEETKITAMEKYIRRLRQGFEEEIYETLGIAKKCIQTHNGGA
ncbi:hypothetical protein M8C21_000657, partial [Ambrosia artemisiifolia]